MVKKIKDLSGNDFISPTYGSRYMAHSIPKYEIPENSLPGNVAYQLIHDELNLDGKPAQNLASFVTTWMEPEAEKLIHQSLNLNLADEDEYPHVIKMEERCVNMLARLLNSEYAVGTATIGSSEAVMLAGLAMKWNWKQRRQKAGLPTDKPNIVMGENVQVVWEKFARYFDVEPHFIPVHPGRYVINAKEVLNAVDENTIGVCAILGSTFTGEFEPIEEINHALEKLKEEQGLDIPLHIDAASGGFVAPFIYPDLKWDFRLSRVVSINISGHKYGLVYPGIGWVIWRDQESLPEELVFHVNYLGGNMPTFTLNFSRPATGVVAQYYNLIRLGVEGYTNIMRNLKYTSDYIYDEIEKYDIFEIVSNKESLPLVAWRVKENTSFDAFELSASLREKGWIVPAYTMPPNAQEVSVLRVVVREHLSLDMAENLIEDIKRCVDELDKHNKNTPIITSKQKSQKIC